MQPGGCLFGFQIVGTDHAWDRAHQSGHGMAGEEVRRTGERAGRRVGPGARRDAHELVDEH